MSLKDGWVGPHLYDVPGAEFFENRAPVLAAGETFIADLPMFQASNASMMQIWITGTVRLTSHRLVMILNALPVRAVNRGAGTNFQSIYYPHTQLDRRERKRAEEEATKAVAAAFIDLSEVAGLSVWDDLHAISLTSTLKNQRGDEVFFIIRPFAHLLADVPPFVDQVLSALSTVHGENIPQPVPSKPSFMDVKKNRPQKNPYRSWTFVGSEDRDDEGDGS